MLRPVPPSASPREPVFNMPAVVVVTIGVLVALHALRSVLSEEADVRLVLDLAFIPAQWILAWDPARASELLASSAGGEDGVRAALAQYVVAQSSLPVWTALTYALLHGSFAHILLNGVWLAAFGTPVARRCGAARFLTLAVASAVAGAAAHLVAHPMSVAPMIGASAGVSGMMAAAARFVFSPAPGSFGPDAWPVPHGARATANEALKERLSLGGLLRNSRAALFLGIWFATNLLFGLIATPLGLSEASIAWEAHIGGFLAGLILFPLVDRPEPVRFPAT
jgi:membrane associated rhomboid family serine protease